MDCPLGSPRHTAPHQHILLTHTRERTHITQPTLASRVVSSSASCNLVRGAAARLISGALHQEEEQQYRREAAAPVELLEQRVDPCAYLPGAPHTAPQGHTVECGTSQQQLERHLAAGYQMALQSRSTQVLARESASRRPGVAGLPVLPPRRASCSGRSTRVHLPCALTRLAAPSSSTSSWTPALLLPSPAAAARRPQQLHSRGGSSARDVAVLAAVPIGAQELQVGQAAGPQGTSTAQTSSCSSRAQHQRAMAGAPFASFTRVLLVGQPANLVRQLAGRTRIAGPLSLLFFLFGLVLAVLGAVRSALVRRVKACQCCRGFGIVRCRLCDGRGSVEWMAKNLHQENCPLCMTRRHVTCPDCGGFHHRKMFIHVPQQPSVSRGPVPDMLG